MRRKDLDPGLFEDMVTALIKGMHSTAESIDGSGGDGGREIQIRTDEKLELFQLKSFTRQLGTARGRRRHLGSANGDCNFGLHRIRLSSEVSDLQAVKTLAHELAHAVLHEKAVMDRANAKLEAESVAYILSTELWLDSSDYTFGYVQRGPVVATKRSRGSGPPASVSRALRGSSSASLRPTLRGRRDGA